MINYIKNLLLNQNRYKSHDQAVIIACFYNPLNSPSRLLAFHKWYKSIKHLNHRILECTIGNNTKSQLPSSPYIETIHTDSLLWHKETLLNKIIKSLPSKFKYVFWLDTDVLFTNNNWLIDSVKVLKTQNILQPFEYCVHLDKGEIKPNKFTLEKEIKTINELTFSDGRDHKFKNVWRSFCSNFCLSRVSDCKRYDLHGHVGFAWGAKREILDKIPLFEKALIGGADHIIAHAAAGHIPHTCIEKSFTDNIDEVLNYSNKLFSEVKGKIGYVEGNLYHLWHGDIKNRNYLKRIQDFTKETKEINEKDENGLYKNNNKYVKNYYQEREDLEFINDGSFDEFYLEMGYNIYEIFNLFNSFVEENNQENNLPIIDSNENFS